MVAMALVLVPMVILGAWYYTNQQKKNDDNQQLHIPVALDSQHGGSNAPWSMHGGVGDRGGAIDVSQRTNASSMPGGMGGHSRHSGVEMGAHDGVPRSAPVRSPLF